MNGVSLLKCICDETRFEILALLEKQKEMCVSDFVGTMKKGQPLISHHLKTLRQCGIVQSRADGKKMMYKISNKQLTNLISNVTKTSKQMPSLCNDSCC